MKNNLLSLLLLLTFTSTSAKATTFTISGKVINSKDQKGIKNIQLKIVLAKGNMVETRTDLNGNYSIEIKTEILPITHKLECNNDIKDSAYIWTMEYRKVTFTSTSSTKHTENFILIKVKNFEEKKMPNFFYQNQAIEPIIAKPYSIDSISRFMKNYPTFIIGIDGPYNSMESNFDSLTILRSEFIKSKLIESGIESERIVLQEHHFCPFAPTEQDLKNLKPGKERSSIWKPMRHIRITILAKDYNSKIKKEPN